LYNEQGTIFMAIAAPGKGFLSLLKKRNFLRLWLAQLISMTILQASNYALLVLIQKTTNSTTLLGLAIISFSVPAIIFGAPAGVFVDHMNKRRVLWGSNCLRALASFLFVIILLTNHVGLIPLYLLTFIISAIGQFFAPAEGATIPMLVSEEELMPALSLFNLTFMLSQALGYIIIPSIALTVLPTFNLSGVTIDSITQLYIIIGILYLVCAVLILSIPYKSFKQTTHKLGANPSLATQTAGIVENIWLETQQGWNFVHRNKQLLLAVIQLSFAGVLILVIAQIATTIVAKLLFLSLSALAFVFAPAGIGLVAGSVFTPRIARRFGKPYTIFAGSAILTLSTLLLPLTTVLARWIQPNGWNTNPFLLLTVACLMLVAGIALNLINTPAQTIIQELTPDWIKGRVLALQLMLYNACSIPILLSIGAISDLFGIDRVLYIMSACEIAFGIWGLSYGRKHPYPIPVVPALPTKKETEVQTQTGLDEVVQRPGRSVDG
jgi:MFS family permease